MKRNILIGLVGAALILGSCTSAATPPPTPRPTAAPTPDFVAVACAGTDYSGCERGLRSVLEVWSGRLVAVCEYPNQTGDIVWIDTDNEADAEFKCGSGLIPGSKVVRVFRLP